MITVATRAALLATILQASASFTWDCSRWRLSGSNLATECDAWGTQDSTTSGKRVQVVAMLDLNDCIGIDPGANAMVWKRGYVDDSKLSSHPRSTHIHIDRSWGVETWP